VSVFESGRHQISDWVKSQNIIMR